MKKIGLLSDTHSFLDPRIFKYFENCDEIWHAGDIGTMTLADELAAFKHLKAVHGNIDDAALQRTFPLDWRFECEGLDVLMTHIGGYPKRYNLRVKQILKQNPPKLFICGHSHILKVMHDPEFDLLHINPGACGNHGFHLIKTLVRFTIEAGQIDNLEVIELGKRGA